MCLILVTRVDASSRTNAFGLEFVIQLHPHEGYQLLPWVIDLFRQWISDVPPSILAKVALAWHMCMCSRCFCNWCPIWYRRFYHLSCRPRKWFSLPISLEDFQNLNIPMHDSLQKDISSLETLAQVALLYIVAQFQPGYRMALPVPALTDNSGAESISNKLFTTTMPLALFLEKLSLLVASSGIPCDVSHLPGKSNEVADALSRWDGQRDPPHDLRSNDGVMLSLPAIWNWNIDLPPRLFPPHATIPWSLPSWTSQCWISRFQLGYLRVSLSWKL